VSWISLVVSVPRLVEQASDHVMRTYVAPAAAARNSITVHRLPICEVFRKPRNVVDLYDHIVEITLKTRDFR
jgi:hypothetical protein